MNLDSILIFVLLIWVHWLADFLLQSDEMAVNKSKSIFWLTVHVGIYTCCLVIFQNFYFMFINGILHWITDFFTSKLSSYYYKKNDRHNFFVAVGFDQAIHLTTLIITGYYFLPKL